MIGNGKSFGTPKKKNYLMKHEGVDISLDRVTIRTHDDKPIVRISLYADTTIQMLGKTKEISEILYLNETPATKYLDPDIVQAFWSEVQRAIEEHIDKAR